MANIPAEKQVDTLTALQMAAWLRETAVNTRAHGDTDRLAPHVAFRLEQAATLLEQQHFQLTDFRNIDDVGEIRRLRAALQQIHDHPDTARYDARRALDVPGDPHV